MTPSAAAVALHSQEGSLEQVVRHMVVVRMVVVVVRIAGDCTVSKVPAVVDRKEAVVAVPAVVAVVDSARHT